ncbi:TPA: helix-turn-helix transcriptional regulator [Klebsiella oxytoca]|nr:helix-turn-helix transcriptional regulator [Klebsiella oxytoca]
MPPNKRKRHAIMHTLTIPERKLRHYRGKMKTVIINLDDQYMVLALEHIVRGELKRIRGGEKVTFIFSLAGMAIRTADLIISGFTAGELLLCDERLKARKPGCRVVILTDRKRGMQYPLPPCLATVGGKDRSYALEQMTTIIRECLRTPLLEGSTEQMCQQCKKKRLTDAQRRVAECISRGMNTRDIAELMNVEEKTVFSHKGCIRSRFGLRTDYDLCAFLRILKKRK